MCPSPPLCPAAEGPLRKLASQSPMAKIGDQVLVSYPWGIAKPGTLGTPLPLSFTNYGILGLR